MTTIRQHVEQVSHWPQDNLLREECGDLPLATGGDTITHPSGYNLPHYDQPETRLARATHIMIPATTWGDYHGSSYDRSNYRSMVRDHPDTFVEVHGAYGFHGLALPLDVEVDEDVQHVLDEVQSLLDYPIWDESDHSDLEVALEEQAWKDYGRFDLFREAEEIARAEQGRDVVDLVEAYVYDLDGDARDAIAYAEDVRPDNHYFVTEDATGSGYWEGADEWARNILTHILAAIPDADVDPAWTPVPVCVGQELIPV